MNIKETPMSENKETVSNEEEAVVVENMESTEEVATEEVIEEVVAEEEGVTEENTEEEEETEEQTKKKKMKFSFRSGGNKKASKTDKKIESLKEEIEGLEKEKMELKDKYLRLYAEFDNYKKRTNREKLNLTKTASRNVLESLLPVLDDFDRAKKTAENDDNEEVFTEGVQLVYDKLKMNLIRKGLKAMKSNGEKFDPDLHEAITEIPVPNEELKGKVIDTVEQGYYLNDKIIRYAKVVVGK